MKYELIDTIRVDTLEQDDCIKILNEEVEVYIVVTEVLDNDTNFQVNGYNVIDDDDTYAIAYDIDAMVDIYLETDD